MVASSGTFKLTLQFTRGLSQQTPNCPICIPNVSSKHICRWKYLLGHFTKPMWSPIYDVAAILTSIQFLGLNAFRSCFFCLMALQLLSSFFHEFNLSLGWESTYSTAKHMSQS